MPGSRWLPAVNIQHIESLNDAVTRITGVQVRETVPDSFFKRVNEVVDIDVSVDALRNRLRQGKIYPIEKIISLSSRVMTGKAAKLRNSPPHHSKISSISCLNTLSVDSPHDCAFPLLPVVVGGQNHVLSSRL